MLSHTVKTCRPAFAVHTGALMQSITMKPPYVSACQAPISQLCARSTHKPLKILLERILRVHGYISWEREELVQDVLLLEGTSMQI